MNIDDAKTLLAFMRAEGLTHARVGDVELTLGEPVVQDLPDDDEPRPPRRRYSILEEDPQLYGDDENTVVPTFPDQERA